MRVDQVRRASKDFQRVLAEKANYPGLARHLVAVGE
jgi:hypothetical protein